MVTPVSLQILDHQQWFSKQCLRIRKGVILNNEETKLPTASTYKQ